MDAKQINNFMPFFKFRPTWDFIQGLYLPHKFVADFTGNQRGKTAGKARQYIQRVLGWHPMPHKNVLYFECPNSEDHGWEVHDFGDGVKEPVYQKGQYSPLYFPKEGFCLECGEPLRPHERKSRIFRFCSETLPNEKKTVAADGGQSAEIKNTIYPEFKKWLPQFLIKKDITIRQPAIILRDPNHGRRFGDYIYEGSDIIIEFVSYSQRVQAAAGVQRLSIWCDEEPPFDFYEEQLPRLIAEDGDMHFSLTPANRMSWTFDELFERAKLIIRTEAISKFYKSIGEPYDRIVRNDNKRDIAVIQAATDDNPTLSKEVIEKTYLYDDPDTIATRRYGIFRQATGRIFNDFSYKIHVIEEGRWFPGGFFRCMYSEER